jgi:phosphohistidine phosphatase
MKQLCIMRHAEAMPPEQSVDDLSRKLTDYGYTQCRDRAARLPDTTFDVILASPALRTSETARIIFDRKGSVTPEAKLYNASLPALLSVIAAQHDGVRSLALVGHNPGLSELAEYLTGQSRHLAPASLLIFSLAGSWGNAGPASITLTKAILD